MRTVLDASVIVKWYIANPDELDAEQALAILEGIEANTIALIQPPHSLAEVAAVLARELPEQAADYFLELSRIFDANTSCPSNAVYQCAIELATRFNHHLFDTLYHAVALEENATLITADRRYYEKSKPLGGIMLLENIAI
ncbi:MAG: PIN domain-containing protein [Betaproteobacteria bacterium HGW-Betaproteobacteria-1]|jgi:predicted nucleic acid-binding protein|nr:MAG: PIN domain-containing protein [Betaproteobacteria bacterium HGW-Betaproteobacteria-1]